MNGKKTQKTHTHTKFDFTADEGKELLNPSREKNLGTHRRRKVHEKSCVTFLLCDPAGTSNELEVQNKWEENTHSGRPGSSQVPRNPLTRWDVSSTPANGIFLTKKLKKQNKNAQRVEND